MLLVLLHPCNSNHSTPLTCRQASLFPTYLAYRAHAPWYCAGSSSLFQMLFAPCCLGSHLCCCVGARQVVFPLCSQHMIATASFLDTSIQTIWPRRWQSMTFMLPLLVCNRVYAHALLAVGRHHIALVALIHALPTACYGPQIFAHTCVVGFLHCLQWHMSCNWYHGTGATLVIYANQQHSWQHTRMSSQERST
jgi:hypothetical protein